MNIKLFNYLVLSIIFFIMGNLNAGVTRIGETEFINKIEINNNILRLQGAAVLKYLIFIDAYTGALYLPEKSEGSDALNEGIVKILELEYHVDISAEDFSRATLQKIKESVNSKVFHKLLPKIEYLNSLYIDVKSGDRYALVYVPEIGTKLIHNSKTLGVVKGADFSKALFGIWIGENPIDKAFRNKLLGIE